MQVLITGGAGYIGSHAAKSLAKAGFLPVVVDSLQRGRRGAVKWGPLVEADLADRDALRCVFREFSIGAVMHFASLAYVGESMQVADLYFRNNVVNALNLLDAMREAGVHKLIFSSTCATYGHPLDVPIRETQVQQPMNPYGESKLMVERLLYWYGRIYGLSWVALRYFNAAGADPDGELGEDHNPETHLIPLAIAAALGMGPPLEVYGTDYDTPDGTAVRDYLHVTDLAQAHLSALGYLDSGGSSAAINLGTGSGHSVRQVLTAVERVTGCKVPFVDAPRRKGDPPCLIADPTQARELLHWRPHHSTLEEMVRTAWNWKTRGCAMSTSESRQVDGIGESTQREESRLG